MYRKTADILYVVVLVVTQIVAIVFYGIYFRHVLATDEDAQGVINNNFRYPFFQDIHIMIYVGFGFLLGFIHRLRLTSLVMCFWTAALSVQYYFLFHYMWRRIFFDNVPGYFNISMDELIMGEVSAGGILIALCAVIGKTNNLQFLVMTIVESLLYTLNEVIVIFVVGARDIGGSMIIHAFGAFFGIGVTWFLNYMPSRDNRNISSTQNSFNFGLIGTLFLWCFWPSFNAGLAATQIDFNLAILNTYFCIIGSCIGAYVTSIILYKGKFQMDHILNATLAGGVVMGAGADLLTEGYVAYLVGSLTGIVSTLLFSYSALLLKPLRIYDVAGIFNLHAMPGFFGGLFSAIFRRVYGDDQGRKQVAGTFISVGIGLAGGLVTGLAIRGFNYYEVENEYFNDIENVYFEDEAREKFTMYGHITKSGNFELVNKDAPVENRVNLAISDREMVERESV